MYNFGVPAAFKLWIDQIVRLGRTFSAGYEGLAKGKKVYVASARGSGGYGSGQKMESADFVVPYIRTVLGFIGITDITFFNIENAAAKGENYEMTKTRALERVEAIVIE